MEKLNIITAEMAEKNIEMLGQMFPNCFTEKKNDEGKIVKAIDFDKLRQELADSVVEGPEERYQFTWPDKRNAIRLANAPTTKTLRPCREESVDFDNTQNLYIEGDNLDVLKILRENYLGKVKMIYIDPPYNTGNDFVYNDDFSQTTSEYIAESGQYDSEGNRLVLNTESNGRFHTDWLNMMYPRLKVAKDLLSDDGVIFISIDDNESQNLKKICDEIFGEHNFVADICVVNNLKGRNDKKYIARANERLLMYVRSMAFEEYGLPLDNNVVAEYKEQDVIGRYRLLELRKRGGADTRQERPNMYYPIYVNPYDGSVSLECTLECSVETFPIKSNGVDGRWRWGKDTAAKNVNMLIGKPVQGHDRYNIYEKDYLEFDGGQRRVRPKSIMGGAQYSTDVATKEYRALMAPIDFSSPKPVAFLRDLIEYSIAPGDDSIVLDFFSGSATTAHAVMQLNANDGGRRKFIMVQLPELIDKDSETYKTGYKNICEIGKERIRRAGRKILTEVLSGRGCLDGTGYGVGIDNYEEYVKATGDRVLDIGFRVLKLDSANEKEVKRTPSEVPVEQGLFDAMLDDMVENIKEDRTPEDLLFQVLPMCNLPLSCKIETKEIDGKCIFVVEDGYLVACFDENINEEVIISIAKMKPYYFVMRDSSLATDNIADNFDQIFNVYSKDTIRRIL